MDILHFLQGAVDRRASDIFIIAGLPVTFKVNGQLLHADDGRLTPSDTQALIQGAYALAGRDIAISESGDDDFSFALQGVSRFRISAYKQRGSPRSSASSPLSCPTRTTSASPTGCSPSRRCRRGSCLSPGPPGAASRRPSPA